MWDERDRETRAKGDRRAVAFAEALAACRTGRWLTRMSPRCGCRPRSAAARRPCL